MAHACEYWGCNHMIDFKSPWKSNLSCTHGTFRKVVHAKRKLAQGEIQTLLDLMTMMFNENMHETWDLCITWSYIVILMLCLFGKMQHI